MRRNSETATLVDDIADFARRLSFQVRQFSANTQKMSVGGGDFDSGQNEKIVDWQTIEPHQAFLEEVIDRIASVVIRDSDATQTLGARGCDQIFRAGNAVTGKERMRVQIDIKRHGRADVKSLRELQPYNVRNESSKSRIVTLLLF